MDLLLFAKELVELSAFHSAVVRGVDPADDGDGAAVGGDGPRLHGSSFCCC
jgi:hypothetical protein